MNSEFFEAVKALAAEKNISTDYLFTKIEAARKVGEYSIPAVLLCGKKKDVLIKAMNGEETGTIFYGRKAAFR